MYISKIKLFNYRGIKEYREINLSKFSSIVGKNDAGKTIVLNAIGAFLDIKNFPITHTDFNNTENPIDFTFTFSGENLAELLSTKLKSKVKKTEGLDEFANDFVFNNEIIYRRVVSSASKSWGKEFILVNDFENPDLQKLYFKSDEEISAIIEKNEIKIPVES